MDKVIAQRLWAVEPSMEIVFVGDEDGPRKGTPDAELLKFAEAGGSLIVTQNRKTMPQHIADHLASGGHTWGVFVFKRVFDIRQVVEDLLLVWSASSAEDWRDIVRYLPL
jgi:hypothetical protein